MRWSLAGPTSRPYPGGRYVLQFDGYRNFGFTTVDLATIEVEQREFAQRYLRLIQPTSVWDIGANVGFWTLWLAGNVDSSCRIRAYEPDARNVSYLRENVARNELTNVEIRDCALSSTTGMKELQLDETGAMNSLEATGSTGAGATGVSAVVRATTIDAEVAADGAVPQFIKLDVEGHELEVLRGAAQLLARRSSVLLLEITREGDEVMELLRECGYLVYGLDGRVVTQAEYYVVASPGKLPPEVFSG
jgi:FkbM family methyltransferase